MQVVYIPMPCRLLKDTLKSLCICMNIYETTSSLYFFLIWKLCLFFVQGYLDDQFIQLEELQDDANPNFVEEVVTLYYRDSARLILNIEQAL